MFHSRGPSRDWLSVWYHNNWDRPENFGNQRKAKPHANFSNLAKQHLFNAFARGRLSILYDKLGRKVANIVRSDWRVLDIGCGYGDRLAQFRRYGCEVCGVEPSVHRAEYARKRGISTITSPIENIDETKFGNKFDLVISNPHYPDDHVI